MLNFPVVLYFPYPSVGGVSVLFLRVAKLLSESHQIILMDYVDGYMAKNLPEGVEFLDCNKKEQVPSDSIIIFQGVYPWRIKDINLFPSTCRVLFWHLHPDNYFPYYKYKYIKHKILKYICYSISFLKHRIGKKLIKELLSKNALVFMDQPNRDSTSKYFKLNLEEKNYLKIFTDDSENIREIINLNVEDDYFHFGWIGRLEDFKSPILLHTLDRLKDVCNTKFEFTIIGNGKDSEEFNKYRDSCTCYKINIIDEIRPDEISSYISNFDILFAMGTSALEGAKIAIPTILLDYSYQPINNIYRYQLIYEKHGFSLADPISKYNFEDVCTLQKKISFILENYDNISQNCRSYWDTNFSPSVFKSDFLNTIQKSNLSINDLTTAEYHKPDVVTKILFKIYGNRIVGNSSKAWQY